MILQVFEHQRITIASHPNLTKGHLEAMARFNEQHGHAYFTMIHKGVKFNHHVGVLQVGNLTIEILPKADKSKTVNVQQWQMVLIEMLKVCQLIRVESLSNAKLRMHRNFILDLYFEIYLNELETLLREGLIKKYRIVTNNQTKFQGRLLLAQHLQHNLTNQTKFYTQHNVYDYNHLINQILYQALLVIKKLVTHPLLSSRVNRLLSYFPKIQPRSISQKDFQQLQLDRKSHRYQTALDIARLILMNYSPDIRSGEHDLLALLFDMNVLFENYVFRQLKKLERTEDIEVIGQPSRKFWNRRNIRPDIVLFYEGDYYVIDTKWKVLKKRTPDDNDLKQMYVYNRFFRAQKSLLVYPKVEDFHQPLEGIFHEATIPYQQCNLFFSKIIESKPFPQLNRNIGIDILNYLRFGNKMLN